MDTARPADARQQPQQPQNAEVAAAVAALLVAGAGAATVPAVATALLPALPAWVLATPALAAGVAEEAARLTLTNPPSFYAGAGEVERRASLENILLRGFYAVAAARRLADAVFDPSGVSVPERLAKALRAERNHLKRHQEARAKNLEGARKTDRARALYGGLLGWYHRNPTGDPRPHHLAAHGANFDPLNPPRETEGLPGTLPFCECDAGPPWPGGRMMYGSGGGSAGGGGGRGGRGGGPSGGGGDDLFRRVEEILRPGGSLIGRPGSSREVRMMPGGLRAAEELFRRFEEIGVVGEDPAPGVRLVSLPGVGRVGLRPTSRSGEPTVDVTIRGIRIREIKFEEK